MQAGWLRGARFSLPTQCRKTSGARSAGTERAPISLQASFRRYGLKSLEASTIALNSTADPFT